MNCETCQTLLTEFALNELDSSVSDLVEQHLQSGCVSCRDEFNHVVNSIDGMFDQLELQSPKNSTWDQVLAAIDSDETPEVFSSRSESAPVQLPVTGQSGSWPSRSALIGLLSIACGFGLTLLTLRTVIDRPTTVIPAGERSIEELDWLSRGTGDSISQLVSLRKPNQPQSVAGGLFIDFNAMQLHVSIRMMEDRQYMFWFVTQDGQWIPAGRLPRVSEEHYASIFDIPTSGNPIAYTAITVEASPNVVKPGSDIALVSDNFDSINRKSL